MNTHFHSACLALLLFTCIFQPCYAQDGYIDNSFNIGSGPEYIGTHTGWSQPDFVADFEELPDGRILAFGGFNNINGIERTSLAMINEDGTVDESFTAQLDTFYFYSLFPILEIQNELGYLICPETRFQVPRYTGYDIIRINQSGEVDFNFTQTRGLGIVGQVIDMKVQSDNKIIVAGYIQQIDTQTISSIARLNEDGSPDFDFINNTAQWRASVGFNTSGPKIDRIKVLSDGKILLAGYYMDGANLRYGLFRINSDGSFDQSFNAGYVITPNEGSALIHDFAIDNAGNIFIAGFFEEYTSASDTIKYSSIVKLNSEGVIDATFNLTQVGTYQVSPPTHILTLPDGNILIASHVGYDLAYGHKYGLLRLNCEGVVDTTFYKNCYFNEVITSIKLDRNDKILLTGHFSMFEDTNANHIVRLKNSMKTCVSALSAPSFQDNEFNIYVNAINNMIQLKGEFPLSSGTIAFILYDVAGKLVFKEQIEPNSGIIQVFPQKLPSGTYFYELSTNEKLLKSGKLVMLIDY